MGFVKVENRKTGRILLNSAKWCESRLCKFLGFQFRRKLRPGEALILVHEKESIRGTSIHMLFVFTKLAAIWINSQGEITHTELAHPWKLYYASQKPARYVLETNPHFLDSISIGDEIDFL